jgi:hypothetical protein
MRKEQEEDQTGGDLSDEEVEVEVEDDDETPAEWEGQYDDETQHDESEWHGHYHDEELD